MKYLSKTLLDGLYDQTENNISKAISVWQFIPVEFFNAQPGPGKWSAAQCLEHLNSYGRYYLPAMEKAIAGNRKVKPAIHFKSGLLGAYFYKIMLPGPGGTLKKKMRSPKDHRPAGQLDTPQVISEFISQLEKLEQLILLARQINIDKARVPISIARFIRLKLGDTMLFYTAHIQRHIQQAERAMEAAGYKPFASHPKTAGSGEPVH